MFVFALSFLALIAFAVSVSGSGCPYFPAVALCLVHVYIEYSKQYTYIRLCIVLLLDEENRFECIMYKI